MRGELEIMNWGTSCKLATAGGENTIRANGGTFIKDRNDNLVDISNIPTQIIRIR